MNKTLKKLLSVILCAALLFTTASIALAAEETRTVVDSGFCGAQGENLTWTLYDDGELVISGEGEMVDFNKNDVPWRSYYSKQIKIITVEEGVTSIGENAFNCDYSKCSRINLPKSLDVVSYIFCYDTGCQTLAICYSGTKEDWSKVEYKKVSETVYGPDFSYEYKNHCIKMYFSGEKPELSCHIKNAQGYKNSPGDEIEVYVHYYWEGQGAEKIIVYALNDGQENIISEFPMGHSTRTTLIIPEKEKGNLYVRAEIVDAQGNILAASENQLITNSTIDNRTLGEKIKDGLEMANFAVFFTTFMIIIPMILAPITEPLAFIIALVQGKFWD